MTDTTRTTAKLATWGIVLTVLGLALAVAAAHHSAYLNAFAAAGRPLVTYDEYGGEWPVTNWALPVAWLAGLILVAGVWCLVAVVWRVADRVDGGEGGRPPGVPLAAMLGAPAEDVAAYRAADRTPSVE